MGSADASPIMWCYCHVVLTPCGLVGNYDCGTEDYSRNMSLLEVEEELRKMHSANVMVSSQIAGVEISTSPLVRD